MATAWSGLASRAEISITLGVWISQQASGGFFAQIPRFSSITEMRVGLGALANAGDVRETSAGHFCRDGVLRASNQAGIVTMALALASVVTLPLYTFIMSGDSPEGDDGRGSVTRV
jgi:hypothetical protein